MIDTLYPVSRLLIRASLALFTCVVLVLIQSAFWSTGVSAWIQVILFAIALLSYFRPHYGLFALAVLAPLGQVGSRNADPGVGHCNDCVFTFMVEPKRYFPCGRSILERIADHVRDCFSKRRGVA